MKKCRAPNETLLESLKTKLGYIDFHCLYSKITSNTDRKISNVVVTHNRKLKNLGINLTKAVDANKIIFNLSKRSLNQNEKDVLSLGLDFGLRPSRTNYYRYFLGFEKLCNIIKNCNKYGTESWNTIFSNISVIAKTSFSNFCKFNKIHSDPINEKRIETLKTLREDNSILITKPDKGRGVVILDREDYTNKMNTILSDFSKFRLLNTDISSVVHKLEDKLNRLLRKVKDSIGDHAYNFIYSSGSRPGTLYGLPKIHKAGNPLRPIVSSIGTFSYNLAKFLVPVISPITQNEYTIENSNIFVKNLLETNLPRNFVMASFDIESLFTNVPLKETTDIIVNQISRGNFDTFGLTK